MSTILDRDHIDDSSRLHRQVALLADSILDECRVPQRSASAPLAASMAALAVPRIPQLETGAGESQSTLRLCRRLAVRAVDRIQGPISSTWLRHDEANGVAIDNVAVRDGSDSSPRDLVRISAASLAGAEWLSRVDRSRSVERGHAGTTSQSRHAAGRSHHLIRIEPEEVDRFCRLAGFEFMLPSHPITGSNWPPIAHAALVTSLLLLYANRLGIRWERARLRFGPLTSAEGEYVLAADIQRATLSFAAPDGPDLVHVRMERS